MGIDMIFVDKEVLTDYGCRVLEAAGAVTTWEGALHAL
jgi:hypothetical protein